MQVVIDPELTTIEEISGIMSQNFVGVEILRQFKETITFTLDDKRNRLSQIFELMTNMIQLKDWSVSLGSLEEVFLAVVKKYRLEIKDGNTIVGRMGLRNEADTELQRL